MSVPSMWDSTAGEQEAEAHLSFPVLPAGAELLGDWERDKN